MIIMTLFKNKRFALNKMLWPNASKFALFMEKENPCNNKARGQFGSVVSPKECPQSSDCLVSDDVLVRSTTISTTSKIALN